MKCVVPMNKLFKIATSLLLIMATVCLIGCTKPDDPNNGGNNGNNGENGGETPEAPAIVSTSEVQYDGTVYFEAVFEDDTKMYFEILSPNEVALVNGEFFYQDNPSMTYIYRGEVVIPENIAHLGTTYSIVSIAKKAFYNNEIVTSVFIPNSVISIGSYIEKNAANYMWNYKGAFQGCPNLNSIHMSENVQDIGHNAFVDCPCYQESVTIPTHIKLIGGNAYSSENVLFLADSCSIAGSGTLVAPVCSAFFNASSIIFGDNVKIMPAHIYAWTSFDTIEVPSTITIIPNYAFKECTNLVSITLNNSINIIKEGTFYGCSNLSSIELPNSVTTIDKNAFYNCDSLTDIFLPNSINQINDYAYYLNNTINTNVTSLSINPPILGNNVFGHRSIQIIYVPRASVEAYKIANGWREFADVIVGI